MIHAHRVSLDDVQLDEIDGRIVILGITEDTGKDTINAVARAADGNRVTGERRDSLDVAVNFGILERKRGMAEREKVLEKVNGWAAGGGWLRINYKEDRRLRVRLVQAPGAGEPWDWANPYTLVFRAYGIPFWQKETPASLTTGATSNGSVQLPVEGSARTVCNVTLENASGALIQNATISAAGQTMTFQGLGLGGNESLVIDHDAEGLLRIRIRNGNNYRSAMATRTPASADDLVVKPGTVAVSFTAQRACRMTASCRARFL